MENQNISDIIESYLKQILAESQQVEIRRAEIANQFNVVPSQINYVIKTRFTIQDGYVVQSKRGGGGYIRIEKVKLLDNLDFIDSYHNRYDRLLGTTVYLPCFRSASHQL